jgi:transglutaminase-like putative cysteine protease
MEEYLKETFFLDYHNPAYTNFTTNIPAHCSKKDTAVSLYYLVRDFFIYDPYHLDLRHHALKGSHLLQKNRAWCVEKSIVLAACARKYGIPSRLGYAIVVNHIGVERLLSYLKRNEIVFHGFVELYVEGVWLKCTPSFDSRICRLSGVSSLDWDGESDSLFQPFQGEKLFMEYVHQYGVFDDVPITLMNSEMKKFYPHLFSERYDSNQFSFFHE